jgi:hypothetical protein
MSKIEAFWENATADDVARVMAGETVEARFRDDEGGKWLESDHSLGGYDSTEEFCKWISSTGCPWRYCQVYREPSWYASKPDPGPGWRLLGKLPDEDPQLGDSVFCTDSKRWLELEAGFDPGQLPTHWYRRRIEPVEPEPKHYVLRVGDSCETPCGNRTVVTPQGSTQRFLNVKAGDTIKTIHGQTITITAKGFEVTQ